MVLPRRWQDKAVALICFICFVYLLHSYNDFLYCQHHKQTQHRQTKVTNISRTVHITTSKTHKFIPTTFFDILKNRSLIGNGTIIISITDSSLALDAINFYMTSIQHLHIKNHLFICLDLAAVNLLHNYAIYCYFYKDKIISKSNTSNTVDILPGDFGTQKYYDVTNMKTKIMLKVLDLGFNVLLCDVDIYLVKDPTSYLNKQCQKCSIMAQMDSYVYNTGFIYAKPHSDTMHVYRSAFNLYLQYRSGHDQTYFNRAVDRFKQESGSELSIVELDRDIFMNGKLYFENKQHHIAKIEEIVPKDIVMLHNNYMGNTESKRYRFRENLMWKVDRIPTDINFNNSLTFQNYYSDPDKKFLLYDNPQYFREHTLKKEQQALLNALCLSDISGRILVLPEFHCCKCSHKYISCETHKCSLLNIAKLKSFHSYFSEKYREHSFLYNSASPFQGMGIPEDIPNIVINSTDNAIPDIAENKFIFTPTRNRTKLQTQMSDFLNTFSNERTLKIHSLYGDFFSFNTTRANANLKLISEEIFPCIDYGQWEERDKWI